MQFLHAVPLVLLMAMAFGGAAPASAQEAPLEGCTFDARVTGFFDEQFRGRAWIGSAKMEGGSLDSEEGRRLHLCVGSDMGGPGCAHPDGPKLFEMTLELPAPGDTGSYARETGLVARADHIFRSGQVRDWLTLEEPGILEVTAADPGLDVVERRIEALNQVHVDTAYLPSARGSFQGTFVPSWKQIRPNTALTWLEDGETHQADPVLQVEVAFNAGVLLVDGDAPLRSEPSLKCSAAAPFGIMARTPGPGDRNVDYEDPTIEVAFTSALDAASVTGESFRVGYLDPDGTFIPVAGELEVAPDGRGVRFVPDAPLRDAVHYRVRLQGGAAGVLGADEQRLPSDVEWRFSTAPDLSGDEGSGGSLDLHVFQVARDEMLVPGKASVLRVYADWEPDPGVHEDEQVIEVTAQVSVSDGAGDRLFEDETVQFVRSDRYRERSVRTAEAEHTANLFGWEPERGDGSPLEATVALRSDATGDELEFTTTREVEYWDHSPEFAFDYYFLKIGPWAGGVPQERRASGRLAAERAETFTLQNFPVVEVASQARGTYTFDLAENVETVFWQSVAPYYDMDADEMEMVARYRENRLSPLIWLFNDAVAPHTDAQILLAFVPLGFTGQATGGSHLDSLLTLADRGRDHYVSRVVHMPVRGDIYLANLLTHEFGHSFGLRHIPDVADTAARRRACERDDQHFQGIEGFRISRDGRRGWNKSHEEGNAESDIRLTPLMHPCGQRKTEAFITNDHYRDLLTSFATAIESGTYRMSLGDGESGMPEAGLASRISGPGGFSEPEASGPGGPFAPAVTNEPARTDRPGGAQEEQWLASGIVHSDGELGGFAPLRVAEVSGAGSGGGPTDAPYRVELRDGAGATLHVAVPRVSGGDSPGWRHFRVTVPRIPGADRIVLLHDGRVVAERTRSSSLPSVEITNGDALADSEGEVTLRWRGEDPDGGDLVYSVLYSPDGEFPWRVLAGPRLTPSLTVDTGQLPEGENPTIRVIARDGFHEAEARVTVSR